MKVELRGIKGFQGHDSYCFTATLVVDGVKRGTVGDDGNGGCFRFSDYAAEKELDGYAKTLPRKSYYKFDNSDDTCAQTAETLVGEVLDAHLECKRLKVLCRNNTVLRLKTTPAGEVEVFKVKFTPDVKLVFASKFGDDLVEIVNETLV